MAMHDTAVEPLSSGHHDLTGDAHLPRSEERKWSVGSAISLTIAISALLWGAINFGVQRIL